MAPKRYCDNLSDSDIDQEELGVESEGGFLVVLKLMFLIQSKKKSKFFKTATKPLKTQQIYQQKDPQKQNGVPKGTKFSKNIKPGAKQDTNK